VSGVRPVSEDKIVTLFMGRSCTLTTRVYSAELLTDFSYTNFTVSYRDAFDRLCMFT